jgi:hypothetical protein
MMSTELGDVRFKVKEGLPNPYSVWIDAEPQSRDGALPGGIAGLGFMLQTKDLEEAEKIAEFLNEEVRQVFIKPKEAK